MTAYEYLSQCYYLDRQIKYDLMELEELRELSASISSSNFGEKVSGTKSTDAPFVRALERLWEKEEKINDEIIRLTKLKEEIQETINRLKDRDERFILLYRYMQRMKYQDIALELNLSERTVRRLHNRALGKIVVNQ
ncbi:MAG: sigma-70 region 4 domain-containing protein [Clostridia bacterium]|nr:sigma-70 region 4 domain-containing protein [Clostridia bacterium]